MNEILLSGCDWKLTGWYRNQWRSKTSMELNMTILPTIPLMNATVPGTIQKDLMENGWLKDLNIGLQSLDAEWVNNREWILEKKFCVEPDWVHDRCELVFEGLDYNGEVYLNGSKVVGFEGMFKPVTIDVTEKLVTGEKENLLEVVFFQVPEIDGQIGYSHTIDSFKSRFNYAWDWCPRIVPVGIWKDVYLRTNRQLQVDTFYPETDVAADLKTGIINYHVEVNSYIAKEYSVEYSLKDDHGTEVYHNEEKVTILGGKRNITHTATIDDIELWWPNGYGNQPIYETMLMIKNQSGKICDYVSKKVGFRKVNYKQNTNAPKDSLPYTVIINGKRVFLKGVNWVPITPFYGSLKSEDYANYLGRFKHMNANLIRVWGGAIIEKEDFYEYCDKNGLLVWQEFLQSSSGISNTPPNNPKVLEELQEISKLAIFEKRSHPSLIIWCGGNELMWDGFIPVDERHFNIGMLKTLVEKYDKKRLFLPSSASGPKFNATPDDFGKGLHHDVHGPWAYMGNPTHYQYYNKDDSLLRSETGTPGTSRADLIRRLQDTYNAWPPKSNNPYWVHRGSWWIQWEELSRIFGEWDEEVDQLEQYCQASRYLQMESLRYSVEATRRREPESSGFIVWMGNEPFANNANTSVIEYDGIPKPAYYSLMKVFSGMHISAKYQTLTYKEKELFESEIYINADEFSELIDSTYSMTARIINANGEVLKEKDVDIQLSTEISKVGQLEWNVSPCPYDVFFLELELKQDNKVHAYNNYTFTINAEKVLEPIRNLPKATVEIENGNKPNELIVHNKSYVVAVGLLIREKNTDKFLHFDQNYLSLNPGEKTVVKCLNKDITKDEILFEGVNL